jgi:hypothetical protein
VEGKESGKGEANQRNTKSLSGTHSDVNTHLPHRFENCARQDISDGHDEGAMVVAILGEVRDIRDLSKGVRALDNRSAVMPVSEIGRLHRADDELDSEIVSLRLHDGDVLGMAILEGRNESKGSKCQPLN